MPHFGKTNPISSTASILFDLAALRLAAVYDCTALGRKLASCSRVIQDLFGHEHVAHGDAPVEVG
jgi:hypothetical protein